MVYRGSHSCGPLSVAWFQFLWCGSWCQDVSVSWFGPWSCREELFELRCCVNTFYLPAVQNRRCCSRMLCLHIPQAHTNCSNFSPPAVLLCQSCTALLGAAVLLWRLWLSLVRVHWGCEGDQRQLQLHPLQEPRPPHLFCSLHSASPLLQIQSRCHVGRSGSQSVAPKPRVT